MKYKCVFYARVSTKNESQKESCEHQRLLCDDYVERHPNYEIVEYYIDDGISGKNDNREQYLKMINRILEGDIDYILAKDCDRLCRSTEVNGALNKILVQTNTMVFYLGDCTFYNPFKRQDRMLNGFRALMGEDYVLMQSEKGKIYHAQKCKNKILNANNVVFGYEWDYKNKRLVVNEDEAKVVRQIFELYVYRDMGVSEISRTLYKQGIVGVRNGNPLSARTLNQILTNEAYIGTLYFNKKKTVDIGMGSGSDAKSRRVAVPKEEWVGAQCPRIFEDDDLFNLAQQIREERNHTYNIAHSKEESRSYFDGKHLFASKVFCGSCGTQYHFGYMGRTKNYPIYFDIFNKKNKLPNESCSNKNYNKVFESTLINITKTGFNMLVENKEEIFSNIYSIIQEAMNESENDTSYIDSLNKRLTKLNKQKETIMNKWMMAPSQDIMDYCMEQKAKCDMEIKEVQEELDKALNKNKEVVDVTSRLEKVKEFLDSLCTLDNIDRPFVKHMVDRIDISDDGKLYITYKFSNQKLITQLKSFEENKKAIQNGLPIIHNREKLNREIFIYKRLKEIINFWDIVSRIRERGMMEVLVPVMPIVLRICFLGWRAWC